MWCDGQRLVRKWRKWAAARFASRCEMAHRWHNLAPRVAWATSYDYQLEAFIDATRGDTAHTGGLDAIRTMEAIDAVYVAAGLPRRLPTS